MPENRSDSLSDRLDGNVETRPHTPANDREEIYYEGSPYLRSEVGNLLLFIIVAAVLVAIPILLRTYDMAHLPDWVAIIAAIVGLILIAIPILKIRTTRYRVSNYRIDFERGLLTKSIDTLELWHVEDIHFRQSLLDRVLNVGDITIISHDDTTPKLKLQGVPSPRRLFETLKQRVISVKRQRGVIKMDVG
jgi:membrane protein YdbS with pleckstrin-like domain